MSVDSQEVICDEDESKPLQREQDLVHTGNCNKYSSMFDKYGILSFMTNSYARFFYLKVLMTE